MGARHDLAAGAESYPQALVPKRTPSSSADDRLLTLLWRRSEDGVDAMATDGSRLFVASSELLHAHDTATGARLWTAGREDVLPLAMAADGHRLIVATAWALTAYDASTGSELWSISAPKGAGRSALIIRDDIVHWWAGAGEYRCLDAGAGREVDRSGPAPDRPAVRQARAGIRVEGQEVVGEPAAGVVWRVDVGERAPLVTRFGDAVMVNMLNGLKILDALDGSTLFHKTIPAPSFDPDRGLVDVDRLYLGLSDGTLLCCTLVPSAASPAESWFEAPPTPRERLADGDLRLVLVEALEDAAGTPGLISGPIWELSLANWQPTLADWFVRDAGPVALEAAGRSDEAEGLRALPHLDEAFDSMATVERMDAICERFPLPLTQAYSPAPLLARLLLVVRRAAWPVPTESGVAIMEASSFVLLVDAVETARRFGSIWSAMWTLSATGWARFAFRTALHGVIEECCPWSRFPDVEVSVYQALLRQIDKLGASAAFGSPEDPLGALVERLRAAGALWDEVSGRIRGSAPPGRWDEAMTRAGRELAEKLERELADVYRSAFVSSAWALVVAAVHAKPAAVEQVDAAFVPSAARGLARLAQLGT
jgi:PQQ-like domain